jgi:hypothetical protein
MSIRSNAKYVFGVLWMRLQALNDDLTIVTPDRVIGGIGPFDFSGEADPSTVEMSIKLDNGSVETKDVDVSGAVDVSAVTVTELYAAINAAGFTDITASIEAVTLRLKIAYTGTDTVSYIQVYGDCAEIALLGQGFGNQFVNSNTIQTMTITPTRKDGETITITDAQGIDTDVLTDGYRKGFTGSFVDTAIDMRMLRLIEGGNYDETTGIYTDPTSEDQKIYFSMELFFGMYSQGENKEADLIGVLRKFAKSCVGNEGDSTHERNWNAGNFSFTATTYKDETNAIEGASDREELTVEEWEALDVENV